jgi:TonB family protein
MPKRTLLHPAASVVFGRSALSRSFRISLVLHAGLLGLLVLFTARPVRLPDTPLRVRILEAPAPQPGPAPQPAPAPSPPSVQEQVPPPHARPPIPPARRRVATERPVPRPVPAPDQPTPRVPPERVVPPAPIVPPPQVAARPAPEVSAPPSRGGSAAPEPPREVPRELPPAAPHDRGGLALGGSRPSTLVPSPGGSSENRPARPSIRDQVASLGTGMTDEADAKHTISLDDRRPQYLDYLGRLKYRIQQEWGYPEEAQSLGLVGELLMVFTVNKDGSLLNLRLVRSSGFPVLDNEALRAVRAAAPFDPIPREMGSEAWNIRASFAYLGPGRARRR